MPSFRAVKRRLTTRRASEVDRIITQPPEVTLLDEKIRRGNGSTSVLERARDRLQQAKTQPRDPISRIEYLVKENGHQRREIDFYRQCFDVLQRLHEGAYKIYQELFLLGYFGGDFREELLRITEAFSQLLETSLQQQSEAERMWLEFWNVDQAIVLKEGQRM